jgi:hypothetical protein
LSYTGPRILLYTFLSKMLKNVTFSLFPYIIYDHLKCVSRLRTTLYIGDLKKHTEKGKVISDVGCIYCKLKSLGRQKPVGACIFMFMHSAIFTWIWDEFFFLSPNSSSETWAVTYFCTKWSSVQVFSWKFKMVKQGVIFR